MAAVNRRAFLATAFGVSVTATPATAAGIHVTGRLDATEQEAQEGYFALGRELMIVTKPDSPIHDDLRSMIGATVQCSVFTVKG